ncbi:MAG TPA: hypothetical protein VKA34_23690 [Balneolales bacterium]|nr:hypothetical protein [Balneolales bacterium]
MFWIWVFLIPLAAIITTFILNYQKNQLKISDRNDFDPDRIGHLENQLKNLTRRIENLETIAASEPDEFTESNNQGNPATNDLNDEKEINQNIVNELAQKRRTKQ